MFRSRTAAILGCSLALVIACFNPALAHKEEGHEHGRPARTEGEQKGPRGPKGTKLLPTRLAFQLDSHHVATGETVTGTARLVTKGDDHQPAPLAGAELKVFVDRTEVDSVTTDADGAAVISAASLADGGHVIRVVYAGDDTHRGAKRAQGVHVGAETDDAGDEDDVPTL